MNRIRKKIFIFQIVACIVVYICFENILIKSIKDRVARNSIEISDGKERYVENVKKINTMEGKYHELYRMKYQSEHMESKLITYSQEQYLRKKIIEQSKENKIKLLEAYSSNLIEEDGVKYILRTKFVTDFFTLSKFLHSVERLEKSIDLEDIIIKKYGKKLTVTATFSIYTVSLSARS